MCFCACVLLNLLIRRFITCTDLNLNRSLKFPSFLVDYVNIITQLVQAMNIYIYLLAKKMLTKIGPLDSSR